MRRTRRLELVDKFRIRWMIAFAVQSRSERHDKSTGSMLMLHEKRLTDGNWGLHPEDRLTMLAKLQRRA